MNISLFAANLGGVWYAIQRMHEVNLEEHTIKSETNNYVKQVQVIVSYYK